MDNKETWQLDEQVRYRRLFDEGVLIHQQKAEALVLNDTAIAFLELCDGQQSTGDIINEMASQYEVGHKELAKDLQDFIKELLDAGIIRAVKTDNQDL